MPEPAAAHERQPRHETGAIRHSFADVNGVRLHCACAGPDAGAPTSAGAANRLILFLHGFPEFWYAWRSQLAEFGRDFLAVAPDMRGYNLSSRPREVEKYDIRQLVGDVVALVHHFGADRCILVGHDWGGGVAWATAIAAPHVVEKLVIINCPHPGVFERELRVNPAQQLASQYMLVFRSSEAEGFLAANDYAALQTSVLGEGLRQGFFTEEDRKAYLEAWSQPGALTGGLNYYRAAEVGPPGESTPESFVRRATFQSLEVTMPTMVIWGERDPYLLPGNLRGLDRYVRHLRIERVPDATHWVVHEKPALVNSLIRDFVAH
jgi:epoxide hydrolase 4